MQTAEIQQNLRAAIAAIRAGHKAEGRALLLQIVEADERVEPAWLWLSAAVDDPQEQLVALENVLTLNPNHAQAKARAQDLRRQLGLEPPPPVAPPVVPEPPPPPPSMSAPPLDYDHITFQCIYCGQPSDESAKRCPHCGRDLMRPGPWGSKGYNRTLLVMSGIQAQVGLLQSMGAAMALAVAYGFNPDVATLIGELSLGVADDVPVVATVLGQMVGWTQSEANFLFGAVILRCIGLVSLVAMLYLDMDSAYVAGVIVALLDGGWNVTMWMLGYILPTTVLLNLIPAGLILVISVLALVSRHNGRVRQWVRLDKEATNALALYVSGRKYAQEEKWALAVLHWEAAYAQKPTDAQYAKDLGLALARLKRHDRAVAVLKQGQEHHPTDAEFRSLLELIERDKHR